MKFIDETESFWWFLEGSFVDLSWETGVEREREKFSKFLGTDASSCVEFRKQFSLCVSSFFFNQELDGQILDDPNKVIPNICN
mgnify:CR=1 FL=1